MAGGHLRIKGIQSCLRIFRNPPSPPPPCIGPKEPHNPEQNPKMDSKRMAQKAKRHTEDADSDGVGAGLKVAGEALVPN